MAFADSKGDAERRARLHALEIKRAAFAEKCAKEGFAPALTLYIAREGGFYGLAMDGGDLCVIYGPGPSEDADFSVTRLKKGEYHVEMRSEKVKATGMGGAFGIGTKGADGFTYSITAKGGEPIEITLLSDVGSFLEIDFKRNKLFDVRLNKRDDNFAWRLNAEKYPRVARTCEKWLKLMTD